MEPKSEPSSSAHTWSYWQGSPELLTHIARVIEDVANRTLSSPQYLIEIRVGSDAEVFRTANEFKANVTPEALRRFDWLGVGANNQKFDVQFVLCHQKHFHSFALAVNRGH